ncbi:anhydro-N-acetylmuramic acid kinase [Rhodohalobacter sulfatireducens]|uniref:Anhydro-N-acetylmuramic acid kinase n=1 Tax=Rhodohalobacter sulfatireducens TaxID=2911366 RepID=A0ABS9KAT2_9BACT|nr:anhydro-N-acetylmuramic acid kinase [Rhodohalobacter sulfatireducens]MCG2587965.1 anhydro-N-acetylmuramic acid kinase [Rhodohalobacter sulfatireducens]
MNPSIKKLADLAEKKSRKIIGLMSGTSLDGLDIALCKVSGSGEGTSVDLLEFTTIPYSEEIRHELKKITSVENVKLKEVSYWHTKLAHLHGSMILKALDDWNVKSNEVDCIASHGQTIYHSPARDQKERKDKVNNTLQIGDGDQIATRTEILTISDFRQKHVAHGGEGAPMAGLVDQMLFSHPTETRILLNIGGIGNFTFLPPNKSTKKSFTTDTGPGNTLIDALTLHYFQKPYDKDGEIAISGRIIEKLLDEMLRDSWLDESKAKTTGPEYFNLEWLHKKADNLKFSIDEVPPEDLVRTVSELSAITIAENIQKYIDKERNATLYVSGGGAHNPYVMNRIGELLPRVDIREIEDLGISADSKEAVIFAVLANEMLAGNGFEFESDEESKKVNFGKVSFPD